MNSLNGQKLKIVHNDVELPAHSNSNCAKLSVSFFATGPQSTTISFQKDSFREKNTMAAVPFPCLAKKL